MNRKNFYDIDYSHQEGKPKEERTGEGATSPVNIEIKKGVEQVMSDFDTWWREENASELREDELRYQYEKANGIEDEDED